MSFDVLPPDGRRIVVLAPYYLTLKTAVDDLTVERRRLSFRVTPDA